MNLADLRDPAVQKAFRELPPYERLASAWRLTWLHKAKAYQNMPAGDWWSIWLMLAGRGAGKTRTAAEHIGWLAWTYPETRWLVAAPTSSDVRSTCYEGDSGLLSVIPAAMIKDYNKALHELVLVNGSLIKGIPASEPERFRGPQFHGGWCCIPGTLIAMADGSEKPIERVCGDDTVMTRHGPRRVLASCASGNPSDLVRMECGETSLTVTEDHPILVGDRWIPAGDIKEGDLLWATNTLAADTRIASYTSGILGQYQKVGSFITRMKIRATTILQTLKLCLEKSISDFMRPAGQQVNCRKPSQSKPFNLCVFQSQQSASSAVANSFLCLPGKWVSSAPVHVLSDGEGAGLFQKLATALSVGTNISPRSVSKGTAVSNATTNQRSEHIELKQMAVRRVERLPNSKTYNLTVEGEHEFIANGIVVHNCDELAAWEYLQESWDMMQFGLRLKLPDIPTRLIATTTPKPKDLIIELMGREGEDVTVTTATTYDNLDNLSDNFRKQIMQYEGTRLGRQEIYGEIVDLEEGKVVNRDMFKLWPSEKPLPKFEYILQSYDCAFSEKEHNDPTACTTWGMFKPQDGPMCALLIDCWSEHLSFPDLKEKALEEYRNSYGEGTKGKRVDLVLIEDKAAGISLIQELRAAHLPVRGWNPGRADKMQRLQITASIFASGRIWLPESGQRKGFVRDWCEGFLSQLCSFPDSAHDDYVDSATQAMRFLKDTGWLDINPPPPDEDDYDDYLREIGHQKKVNPYAV